MATTYKYVVDKDWDSQQITDIVSYKGAGQNFTFGTDGFASIYETILDANDIKVPGAVGADPTTPSPVPYTGDTRQTIFVVNGAFSEEVSAAANAKYTLDFSSIPYVDPDDPTRIVYNPTSFEGSFTSTTQNDVGIRVSGGTVLFGAHVEYEKNADGEYIDADGNPLPSDVAPWLKGVPVIVPGDTRTTITLNRTVDGSVGQWADSEFVVGGALAASDLKTVTAIVTNTDLTVANWVWVGSQNDVNQTADDKVSNFLVVNDSTVTGKTLQVRHTGDLKATNSTFAFKDMILRGNATFDKTTITLSTYISNVYGENNFTATLTLKNGSTLTSTTDLQIGKPDSGTTDVKRAGALVLNASSIGYVIPDNPETTNVDEYEIVRSGNIAVKQNGSITMDAASKIYASALTNDGAINITIDAAGEDWINATSFNNTDAAGKINIGGSFDGGVKRVIYATDGAVKVADIVVTATSTDGKPVTAATRAGKVALAAGVDYTTIYLSNSINEDDDFAKEVKDTQEVSYYVDFNAFQLPKSALEEGVKPVTTTILIDGTTAAALTYAGVTTASIDGLTFAKDGTNAVEATDVEKNVVFTLSGMDPTDPESYRELTKGITVGEGVTFTADKLYQTGKDAVTTINGELKMGTYDVTHAPGTVIVEPAIPDDPEQEGDQSVPAVYNTDPIVETLPDTFQVAGGKVNVTSTGSLTGAGIVSVIATLRDDVGKPIKAEMNVTGAPINLSKLEIGANSTVTLKDIAPTTTGASQAVFGNVVMRKTNVSDFTGPVLTIINSQVDVTNSFDTTKGLVNINFQSQLFVKTATATIEGGDLNLTVTAEDIALLNSGSAKLFYTIVHAAISDDVNLTCDHDVDGDTYIDGTRYVYTSLGGQGLFVMHEDVAKNIYVNAAWTNKQIGEVVGDGMFYGINAFETFTGALSAASELENACSITLLSDVTENNLKAPFYKFKDSVTVTGDNKTVTWDVTEQYSTYYDDGAAYFLRDGESTPTVTFNDGTSFKVTRTKTTGQNTTTNAGVLYVGYDAQDKTGAAFNGTIQDTTIYVSRWANLTVTGTVIGGLASQIYLRKHGKLLIDGTGKTFGANESQVSTASSALIYGGTATVLNSVVSIGDQLKVINRNVLNEAAVNAPAETTVFGATNSTISAKSFDSNKVGTETNGDVKDSVTSLVKSTMTITNGVDNYGTFYVGVAVKAKDITEGETIVKNTVEVDESITGEAAASTLIVGSTVTNKGVIELKYSTANITKDLINNGEFSITDSTVNVGKIQNGINSVYGTINVLKGGVLNTTTAGALDNKGYGIINVIGGTITAGNSGFTVWNYGVMNLDDATFVFGDNNIRNMNSAVININGDVSVFNKVDGDGKKMGVITNAEKGKVVFGVSNDTSNGAANVDVNIVGGTVAFSAGGLTFDMAVTGVNNAGTADEAIASAKLSGGTVFANQADLILTDSGFKVVDQAAVPDDPDQEGDQSVAEVSHMVWNNTNFIKIGASGSLTLDDVAGWDNSDDEYVVPGKYDSLVVTGLDIAAGGLLTMDWSQCLTVNGDLNAATLPGGSAIEITLNPLEVYTSLNTDKLVIANNDNTDYSFVKNYEAFFTVHHDEEGFVNGLYLDASKFVKVSQAHEAALEDGWYNQFNTVPGSQEPEDQGAVDSVAGVVLGIDGAFTNVFLKDKVTMIVGSEDEEATLTFGGIFAGGFDVSAMKKDTEYVTAGPASLNMKIHEGETNVAISAGTFSNAVVVGGDLVKVTGGTTTEWKVNYYRVGDINTVIDGGIFEVTSAGGQRMIIGGEYYQAATKDDVKVSIGAANLTGDINLTISGGSFKGYDVYGGNYANQKTFGKYATIDGKVTVTLDSSDQALVFATNTKGDQGGKIFAGSFGAGAITGDAKVILTGDKDITFEKLFGGSTGDFRSTSGTLESNVEGKRILSFTGFKGGLNDDAVIDGFNTVEISGVNDLNFDVADLQYFNLDVTNWKFAADAAVTGTFAFDFSGDKVDMSALNVGWELNNVTFNNKTQFAFAEGIGFNYDAESKLFSLVTLQS